MQMPTGFSSWPKHTQKLWAEKWAKAQGRSSVQSQTSKAPARADPEQDDPVEGAEEAVEPESDEPLYIQYRAKKITGARAHPDAIVETGSLSSVEPPDPTYAHHLQDIVDAGLISDAQLETVVYANMRFREYIAPGVTSGFFLGDGAGVGKGRQIAALILEHWRAGRTKRVLWVSVSNDLRYDAVRDLSDIGARSINVYPREKDALPKGKLDKLAPTGGVRSKTAEAVLRLQNALPTAHVLYSSATGASTPSNLAYMVRLGMAGFSNMDEMIKDLKKSGLGALELYSMALKATGGYVSRTLSYDGAEFNLVNVNMDSVFRVMYDRASRFVALLYKILDALSVKKHVRAQLWGAIQRFFRQMLIASKVPTTAKVALQHVREGMCVVIGLQSTGEANSNAVREASGNEADDLISAPRVAMQQFIERQFPYASDLDASELSTLEYQVRQAVAAWGAESNATATAASGAHGPVRQTAARMRSSARVDLESRGSGPSGSRAPGRNFHSARAQAQSEDDEPMLMEEKSLDAVLEDRRQQAIRSGQFLDLTEEVSDEAKKAMEREVKLEEAQEEAHAQQREADAVIRERKEELAQACEDLKTAEADLQKAWACRDAKALGRMRRQAESETALYQKATVPEPDSPEEGRAGRRRRRAAPSNLAEQDPSPRPLQKRKAAQAEDYMDMTTEGSDSSDDDFEGDSDVEPASSKPASKSVQTSGSRRSAGRPLRSTSKASIIDVSDSSEDEIMSPVRKRPAPAGKPVKMKAEPVAVKPAQVKAEPAAAAAPANVQEEPILIEDDTPCQVCSSAEGGDTMLLCDAPGCNKGCHMACMDPPLTAIPEGDWICQGCSKPAIKEDPDDIPVRAHSRKVSLSGNLRLRKAVPPQADSPDAENRDPAALTAKPASSTDPQPQMDGKLEREMRLTVLALEKRAKAASAAVDARKAAVAKAEKRAAAASYPSPSRQDEPAAPRQRQGARGRASGSSPAYHSGRHIELSDTEVDAVAAFPAFRHAVKSRGWGGNAEVEATESDEDAGLYGYGFEDDEGAAAGGNPHLKRIKKLLLRILQSLELPPNPLDQLVELMGGEEKVAEMTGRKGGFVRQEDNTVKYQQRRTEESRNMVNIKEKESFMRGDKLIAIISEAASVGISLQADRRVKNQRRRCHLTLELPWSADKAIQQFGRSHRSNQASAPLYRILVTTCGGEHRFASSAAKRLQSLGALLKGDRRALGAGADLKEFDIDNKYGLLAVQRCLKDINGETAVMEGVKVPSLPAAMHDPNGGDADLQFFDYMRMSLCGVGILNRRARRGLNMDYVIEPKATEKVSFFLNRLMALPNFDQEMLFSLFSSTLDALIQVAKSKRTYDTGIQNMNASYTGVKVLKREIIYTEPTTGGHALATQLAADRGLSWEGALERYQEEVERLRDLGQDPAQSASGFYVDGIRKDQGRTGHPNVALALEVKKGERHATRQLSMFRPNNHLGSLFTEMGVLATYEKVSEAVAKRHWTFWFNHLEKGCIHGHICSRKARGDVCYYGTRILQNFILSGAVLPLLSRVSHTVETSIHGRAADTDGNKKKPPPRVIKVTLDNGEVLVGMNLLREDMALLKKSLIDKPINGPSPAVPAP
ncbi:hypothetical protein WJX84_000197 [Apatococcus fuscideae]|uniref:PHD-type domain-containing protein n=1 Tax=Apatococcus fuscideae TaxID=2026836 RepID=A0AAW1T7Y7_9CHLO